MDYWTHTVTVIKGPATNCSMKRLSFNPVSFIQSTPYLTCLDFDFILSIDLPSWPDSALEWITRPRLWPPQHVVLSVVATACSVVPKTGPTGDPFTWRLSFSRGEVLLSKHVPDQARLAFLAVKLFYKQKLKSDCLFLRSYHLKTMFYHFLEKEADLKSMRNITYNFLIYVEQCISKGHCPHYFIETLNLFRDSETQTSDEEILKCLFIIRAALRDFPNSIYDELSDYSQTVQFQKIFFNRHPFRYCVTFLFILPIYASLVLICQLSLYFVYTLTAMCTRPLCNTLGLNPDTSSNVVLTVLFLTYVNKKLGIIALVLFSFAIVDWGYACRYILDFRICVKYNI